ncbi:MAG: hypothetical protein OEU54_09685 [Gemmatimonadota bacterium]|nr:hypothetical protein [Gemmatimonadota bacterium]
MTHLTPEEIELFAAGDHAFGGDSTHRGDDARTRHLLGCEDCREAVEALRAIVRCLAELPEESPARSVADGVMRRVDLPIPWLEEVLEALPEVAPATGFASSVLDRVDLPTPWLDAALEGLGHVDAREGFAVAALERVDLPIPWLESAFAGLRRETPAPGFATSVLERVRLPIPWHQRIWRFARRRRVALAAAAASTVAVSATGAAWLFGAQGVTPVQFVTFVLVGVKDLALQGLVALGGVGYELGLVDAGTSLTDISPLAAFGSLALASLIGLSSLFVMARLMRTGPELRLSRPI